MKKLLSRFIGTKAFYRSVIVLLIPIVVQQFITNLVGLLDNIMVGGLGDISISAVGIINQIMMVFNLAIFGGLSGCSIFGAQFFGKGDMKGVRHTLRFKMYFAVLTVLIAVGVFLLFGDTFANLFLQGEVEANSIDPSLVLNEAHQYLMIMLLGLLPFAVVQVYAGSLREAGETLVPMISGMIAIGVNLIGNFFLINGPIEAIRMGVSGAAIATVASRWVEMVVIMLWAHRHTVKYPFVKHLYSSFHVPGSLIKRILITGSPLLLNEILWSLGMTTINQIYSTCSLNAMPALNISSTAWNLFCVIMFGMGSAISIMVGQELGAGRLKEARDIDRKLIFLSVTSHLLIGAIIIIFAPIVPLLYNVSDEVRGLAASLLTVAGASLPIHVFAHVTYFTIRSGGKTLITFLFDAVYTWTISVPCAYLLVNFTDFPLLWVYFCVQFIDIIKVVIGLLMLRSDFWAKNIVQD